MGPGVCVDFSLKGLSTSRMSLYLYLNLNFLAHSKISVSVTCFVFFIIWNETKPLS